MRAEGKAGSMAGARWAAMKELEKLDPTVDPDEVRFETLEEGADGVRVAAIADPGGSEGDVGGASDSRGAGPREDEEDAEQPEPEAIEEDEDEPIEEQDEPAGDEDEPIEDEDEDEPVEEIDGEGDGDEIEIEDEREPAPKAVRSARRERRSGSAELPDAPDERAREIVERVLEGLDLDGEIDVDESEEELLVTVSGEDLGLFIGKHGSTIDAIQVVCSQAAYRGSEQRKRVIVDAEGYRAQRAEALHRQADRAAADAVEYGRAVELDSMTASERRVVHNYLKEQPDVETHSEGDEPYRRIVVTPTSGELRYD